MDLEANVKAVHQRIEAACARAGREPASVTLVSVTKGQPPEVVCAAAALGLTLFGENKVQEAKAKIPACPGKARWHMIGHLQTNKAAKAAELFTAVDSVDSLRLAEKLNAAARDLGKKLSVLLEINVGGEAAKSGISPDSPELDALVQAAPELGHLELRGLMTVPPYAENPEDARPYFRELRNLRDRISTRGLPLETLSMGMSHDFEVAIEEGSTCVRVGTAIFGEREKR